MSQDIEINIEELVLHGFAPADRRLIGEALELALKHAFTANPMTSQSLQSANVPFTDAGNIHLNPNSPPRQGGTAIANTLHANLTAK